MAHFVEPPQLVSRFSESDVLVIAPHMDDEVIGCGGTLLHHVAAGARVAAVFMTDGSGHVPNNDPMIRHDEALAVARFIGADEPVFLDGEDGRLKPTQRIVEALRDEFVRRKPAVVYVPWFDDLHPDHSASNNVIWHAAQGLESEMASVIVRCYEVWAPLKANVAVDISSVMNKKLMALQMYRSQFVGHDPSPIVGLNRYRSLSVSGPATYVECFAEFSWKQYLQAVPGA